MGYIVQVPGQLSSHLRALRKAKKWSQAELGARLGLSQTRIARIEGDPLSVSVEQLLRVLSALGAKLEIEPQVPNDYPPHADSGTSRNSQPEPTHPADPDVAHGDW